MTKHTHNFVTVKAGTHDTSYQWLTSLLRKLRLVNKLCTYVVSWLLTKFERRPPDQRNNTVRMLNEDVKKNWNLQVENLQHWFFIKVKGFFYWELFHRTPRMHNYFSKLMQSCSGSLSRRVSQLQPSRKFVCLPNQCIVWLLERISLKKHKVMFQVTYI